MGDSYIGRRILVRLKDGRSAEGTLSDIDADTGTMMLYQAQVSKTDGRVVTLSAWAANRNDIADLRLVGRDKHAINKETRAASQKTEDSFQADSEGPTTQGEGQGKTPGPRHQQPQQNSKPQSQGKNANKKKTVHHVPGAYAQQDRSGPLGDPPRPRSASPVKSPSKANGVHAQQQTQADPLLSRPASSSGLDKDGHFDFSAGLLAFDKAKVFQEIRDNDQSDPAQLLVAHNKRANNERYTTKLLPSENVLDDGERQAEPLTVEHALSHRAAAAVQQKKQHRNHKKNGQHAQGSDTEGNCINTPDDSLRGGATADISANDSRPPDSGGSTDANLSGKLDSRPLFKALDGNATCSALSTQEYKELLSLANTETGPNTSLRVENAARGIAHYILHTLASPKRGFFTSSKPKSLTVAVLAGACNKGHSGLRTAAHLANKGVHVVVWLSSQPASLDVYARMLTASGGRIVQTVADLPPNPSLVIDALSDSPTEDASAASFKPKQQQQQQRKALAGEGDAVLYANSNAAPTLSIDGPSFLDFTSGAPTTNYHIQPRFSAVLGAFRPVHQTPRLVGELALVDVGLPLSTYKRLHEGWPDDLWGSDWVASCIKA